MNVFGYELTIARKAAAVAQRVPLRPLSGRMGGWWPVIREPFTGAWQQNQELVLDSVLANPYVFACVRLISSDIGKLRLRLVEQDAIGIWHETTNPAWSPVLRRPNEYQTVNKFVEQWLISKLTTGNTYVLKSRDQRGVVDALYVLDPQRVTVLVSPDGAVYYQLNRDDLSGLPEEARTVPAREIIHDRYLCLFHQLIGVSPIFACGLAALQGLKMQSNSTTFFGNGAVPGGIITAPGHIDDDTAKRIKDYWDSNYSGANVGKVAVLGDGLAYEGVSMTAVDAQLIEQLQWTGATIATCYGVPIYMIDESKSSGSYANDEPRLQHYYAQCLQALINAFELCLDDGLALPSPFGTEFDIDDLIWMDTSTKTKAASDAIGSGALSPDEARRKWYGLGPVAGGDTPYMQQQYFSLAALDERDSAQPFAKAAPAPPAVPAQSTDGGTAAFAAALRKHLELDDAA